MELDASIMAKKMIELRGNRTQEEVANDLQISKSALSMYESGRRIPRDAIKLRIATYYGKSIGFIFFNENSHEM